MTPPLPVEKILPDLRAALARVGRAVLVAPPGTGKTTLVPPGLWGAAWLGEKRILLLEPRRLAARAAAARMAELLDEEVGRTIGLTTREDRAVSASTRIEVVTEGILPRRLQRDPTLAETGLVIFDEFHERSLEADLSLAFLLDAASVRTDLRILVMSATIEAEPVARILGEAEILRVDARAHPVEIRHLDRPVDGPLPEAAAVAVRRALREEKGVILLFLPGEGEIRRTAELLADLDGNDHLRILPLYGNLDRASQDAVLRPDPAHRRVVLATNIAETSLTIPGVRVVVDAGWRRAPRFDPASGISRLETIRATRAEADQRAGRAGRTEPGVCHRLWTRGEEVGLLARRRPEILEADLAPLALETAAWGARAESLAWIDPPPSGALAAARETLAGLGLLDDSLGATPLGREVASLPFHPRLGAMLVRARDLGWTDLACDLAAVLSSRAGPRGGRGETADLGTRIGRLDLEAKRDAARARRAIGKSPRRSEEPDDAAGILVALAYPDRVAVRRADDKSRFLLASGRGAVLPEGDRLSRSEFLAVASINGGAAKGSGDGRVRLAAPIQEESLRKYLADRIVRASRVEWSAREGRVVATEEERLGEIVLSRRPHADADPDAIAAAAAEGLRAVGLPWSDAARSLQARVAWLRARGDTSRGGDWPDLSDAALLSDLAWLAPFLSGARTRADLSRIDLASALAARLTPDQHACLASEAPSDALVPSGRRLPIEYIPGETPRLAVRIQEVFGVNETPRAGGEPVVVHLLTPARRPVQMTRDLASFWKTAYPEIRRQLARRYPRHDWPEDPLAARPSIRPAKRKKR